MSTQVKVPMEIDPSEGLMFSGDFRKATSQILTLKNLSTSELHFRIKTTR